MSTEGEKLAADIKILVHDAEDLVRATAAETGETPRPIETQLPDRSSFERRNKSPRYLPQLIGSPTGRTLKDSKHAVPSDRD